MGLLKTLGFIGTTGPTKDFEKITPVVHEPLSKLRTTINFPAQAFQGQMTVILTTEVASDKEAIVDWCITGGAFDEQRIGEHTADLITALLSKEIEILKIDEEYITKSSDGRLCDEGAKLVASVMDIEVEVNHAEGYGKYGTIKEGADSSTKKMRLSEALKAHTDLCVANDVELNQARGFAAAKGRAAKRYTL